MPFKTVVFTAKASRPIFRILMDELDLDMKNAQKYLDQKRVMRDGETLPKSYRVTAGEKIEVVVFEPDMLDVEVVFETEDFAVFNKPSGLLVHPKGRNSPVSLLDAIKSKYGKEANIVHRLDKDTSGLVLCAKNRAIEIELKMLFENRTIEKEYLALVFGNLKEEMMLDFPLLEPSKTRKCIKTKISDEGKESYTKIEPLSYETKSDMTIVKAIPKTGRTHQIRAHLAHINHPIVGDLLYVKDEATYKKYLDKMISEEEKNRLSGAFRLMLHASSLSFTYGERFCIRSDALFKKAIIDIQS